jgi:hypothetical protein
VRWVKNDGSLVDGVALEVRYEVLQPS